MIIIKIKGGLGNQMFQYAVGKKLSLETGEVLFLDANKLPSHNKEIPRDFDLIKFNIDSKLISSNDVEKFRNPFGIISRAIRKIRTKILFQYNLDFHPNYLTKVKNIIKSGKNVYIEGYFQSERNFAEIREILLSEFSLKEEFKSPTFEELRSEISKLNSVSVHIRRGDYVNNPKVLKYHGICSVEYYKNAMSKICESIENPVFYFFSDDPNWISENFDLNENTKIISGKSLTAPEELILMSSCKHNIIANSTFSWWGAWLNQNYDKIVISPTPWVNFKFNPHKNITPETWINLPKSH